MFRVPEMLEAILLELPMKDLLLSQSVCKTWKNAIKTSTKLQQKLFLIANGRVWTGSYTALVHSGRLPEYRSEPIYVVNPLLKNIIRRLEDGRIFKAANGGVKNPKEMLECQESWMKMPIMQPPFQRHMVDFQLQHSDRNKICTIKRSAWAHKSQGLTMADVIHAFDEVYSTLEWAPEGGLIFVI